MPQILAALQVGLLGRLGLGAARLPGKVSGMPWAWMAIRLVARWSCGLPSRSVTRALLHAEARGAARARSGRARRSRRRCVAPRATGHSFSCLRSTGSMTPPPPASARKMPSMASRGARQPLDGARLIGVVGVGAERGDARQHAVADAGGRTRRRCLLSTMRMRGGGPAPPSQVAGRAMNSPSASRSTISSTVTGGSTPGRCSLRREPAISPSSAMSRSSAFSAMRSPPLMPKARAISRLPALPLAPCEKVENLLLGRKLCPLSVWERSWSWPRLAF